MRHVHFDYTDIAGWQDVATSLLIRVKNKDLSFAEFKDTKAKAVVQAIENVVEFKTRIKEKVLTAFKEAQVARASASEEGGDRFTDVCSWVPSPDDRTYYE